MSDKRLRCTTNPGLAFFALVCAYALAGTVSGWLHPHRNLRRWLLELCGGIYIGLGAAAAFTGTRLATTE